jgi:TolB-like protein
MAMKRLVFLAVMLMGTVAMAAGPAKVLLVPFDSVGPVEKAWVAKALQQNLIAELSRVNSVQTVTSERAVGGMEAALKAAGDAGADYVVFGSYQAVEGDLRITGQVVDVSKRQAVAGLKTTGSQRDLFGMEDVISHQVKRALPQPVAVAKPEMLQQPPAAPPVIEANGPVVMDTNERAQELENQIDRAMDRIRYSSDYAYDYYPPYNYYSGLYTPYYAIPFVVFRGNRHHHGSHFGSSFSGSFSGHNFSGSFQAGGTVRDGRNYSVPRGNYVSTGRMTMQSPGRR